MAVYPQELDNMVRWRPFRVPFYEVYYLKFPFAGFSKAAWLRYTLLAPRRGWGEPSASVWAMVFDAEDPAKNVAVKETFAIDQAVIDRDIFYFQLLESNAIYNNGARGRAASGGHAVAWELQYPPNEASFKLLPRIFYHLPFPQTKWVSPNWSIRPSGWIEVDGVRFPVESKFGCQAHLWGSRHVERWAWTHGNSFHEDGELAFEALTAQARFGKKLFRPMTLMALRLPDKRFLRFTRMTHWYLTDSRYDLSSWELRGSAGHWRLHAALKNDPARMIGVTYTDTDESKLYCYHSESAVLHLQLEEYRKGKFQLYREWNSFAASAFEVVERSPLAGMKLHL
jgi:hypothetical protein